MYIIVSRQEAEEARPLRKIDGIISGTALYAKVFVESFLAKNWREWCKNSEIRRRNCQDVLINFADQKYTLAEQ